MTSSSAPGEMASPWRYFSTSWLCLFLALLALGVLLDSRSRPELEALIGRTPPLVVHAATVPGAASASPPPPLAAEPVGRLEYLGTYLLRPPVLLPLLALAAIGATGCTLLLFVLHALDLLQPPAAWREPPPIARSGAGRG